MDFYNLSKVWEFANGQILSIKCTCYMYIHVGRPAHRLKNEKGTPSCDTNEISISPQFKPHTKELLHNAANCLHTLRSNDHTPEKVSSLLLVLPS